MKPSVCPVLLASALLQCGCGLLLQPSIHPAAGEVREAKAAPDDTPRAWVYDGEIRDFATYRLEPGATIEFWSEDASYLPTVKLDGQGRYSIRVDACQREAGAAEQLAASAVLGVSVGCTRWIGKFGIRARLGDRCSLAEPDPGRGSVPRPLVLWLRDCRDPSRGGHPWRPAKVVPEALGREP